MQPIRNSILWKPLPSKEVTDNGLFVPENCRQVRDKGTIVAVAHGVKGLKVGDIGYRVKAWGEPYFIDNELHFLMDAQAILALE